MTDKLNAASEAWAIQLAKARYCAASDMDESEASTARALLEDLLHPEFTADYTQIQFATKAAFIAFITGEVAPSAEWVWHGIDTPLVELNGDTALGRWTVIVRIKRKGTTEPVEIFGRYTDQFEKVGDAWKIRHIYWRPLV